MTLISFPYLLEISWFTKVEGAGDISGTIPEMKQVSQFNEQVFIKEL